MNHIGQLTTGELGRSIAATNTLLQVKRYLEPSLAGHLEILRNDLRQQQEDRDRAENRRKPQVLP